MKYQVKLKAPEDMTEADYLNGGNTLCEERYNGIKYGIWFDSLEEAKGKCIENNGYGIIDYDGFDYVWYNPNYQSESIKKLQKYLGRILLPH